VTGLPASDDDDHGSPVADVTVGDVLDVAPPPYLNMRGAPLRAVPLYEGGQPTGEVVIIGRVTPRITASLIDSGQLYAHESAVIVRAADLRALLRIARDVHDVDDVLDVDERAGLGPLDY